MASLLNTLCKPYYSSLTSLLKVNGKECFKRLIPLSVQTLPFSNVFYNVQLNLSDFPYLLTKKKKQVCRLVQSGSKRAITDQIFSGLVKMLSIEKKMKEKK